MDSSQLATKNMALDNSTRNLEDRILLLQRKFDCRLTRQQFSKNIYENSYHKPMLCVHNANMSHVIYMNQLSRNEGVAQIGTNFYLTKEEKAIGSRFTQVKIRSDENYNYITGSLENISEMEVKKIILEKYIHQHEIIYKICFDNGSKRLIHFY